MEKGEGEEDINSILNNFNSKMSHIMNMDGWEDPKVSAMKNNVESSQPKLSFVKVVSGSSNVRQNPKVKFRAMTNFEKVKHSDFVLPVVVVKAVKHKFENSLVGFFVGKKVAFPLVKNYVTNTWSKFGFEKVMSDADGLFYFKFASLNGLEQVLEQGPWLIRNIPLILTKWSPNMSLSKDEVTRVPIWVKFHKVPVVAYSKDGLSLIATQVGTPIMLDAFTSAMCVDTWGRIGFEKALIKVSTDKELKQEVIIAVPNIDKEGEDHTLVKIKVEYEWKPPICLECHVFGHGPDRCLKHVVEIDAPAVEANEDGFIQVVNRKSKGKSISSNPKGNFSGVKVNNAKKTFKWEPEDNIFDGNNGETSGGNEAAKFFRDKLTKVSQCNDDTNSKVEETFVELNLYLVKPRGQALSRKLSPMFSVTTWNIRGLNRAPKQSEVRQVVNENQLSMCVILESHVDVSTLSKVCSKVFRCWDWTSNASLYSSGCRIIVGWNVDVVHTMVISLTSQALHIQRRLLWNELGMHKLVVRGSSWVLMGDLNVALNMEDVYAGASSLNSAMY
ncbi:hypothetical protein Tco_1271381 [Tanacetum coccineum]